MLGRGGERLLSDDVVRVEGVELGVPRAREPQPEVDRHVALGRRAEGGCEPVG